MNNDNYQTFFDCGISKVRAGTFNTISQDEAFYTESEFFTDRSILELKIQKIITFLERSSNKYIDKVNLMLDSPKMLSVGISLCKKIDGSKLKTLYFFPSNRWDILTYDNILIKLPQDNISKSLNLAYKIISNNDFKNKNLIDLRINNHLIIK